MRNNEVIDKLATKEYTNIDQKVRDAQIKLLYQQTQISLIGVLLVSLTASVVFWEIVPQWKLSLWAGIIIILTLARGGIVIAFKRRDAINSDIDRWAKLHTIGVIVSGLTWVIPFVFFWPSEQFAYQLVWPIFVIPMSTAAIATYYTWRPSYISFLFLSALPVSLRFFYEGGILYNFMGLLSLFFIAILLRAGKVMHDASVRAFELGIRNEALNMDLKAEITTREQLNAQLQQEIAERKLAENEIRKLSKVFLDGTNPCFIEDLHGNIQEMNNEAVNVYGFSREELVNKSSQLLVPDGDHEKMDELIKLCVEGKLVRDVECLRLKKDGKEIPVLMTLSLLTDEEDNPFGIASIDSNISEQKNIEKQLTKSKAAAESANATKDKFFKIISHDLKSPFSSIIGFSDLLITEYDSFDDLERKNCIQEINTSSLNAYSLLDNLLTWARTQTDEIRINKEKVNLKELVATSISTYLLNADSKNIKIINKVQAEVIVSIDKNTALTFIRNIVNNAIKFTHKGGQITIDSQVNEDSISLHITDTGVGMSPEVIDNLFQIDKDISTKGTNNEKGTGLGLILCKEFIERNGGSIIVKSEVNKGSEFIISLPQESDS
ncbi:ATP-binding protein [Labilibaculum sp. K2S]|uniref:sensor histidine kinase n=1 Tax=Labilibaculum sp. K2S TaxID=3056386 RepID=UPI0025A3CCBC|nr:ATP-binding protein [Labilibaculum sp. K2S]MDM8160837.1 ATP-binding protein [Labilibaculum sp. K2S]